jgi:polysaccharide export outer membrane protein
LHPVPCGICIEHVRSSTGAVYGSGTDFSPTSGECAGVRDACGLRRYQDRRGRCDIHFDLWSSGAYYKRPNFSGHDLWFSQPGAVQGIKVGATGDIVLPYLGTVKIAGLTISEAAAYLKQALKDGGFLTDPQISVGFVDSPTRAITVLGEVMRPAPVPAHGQIRLLDVISACGGFTPLASHTITVKRNGSAEAITVELGADPGAIGSINIPLLPGDTVLVPKVGSIFVLGQVKTPSVIPLGYNSPITVLRAIAMAGGVNYGAGLSKARIIRTNADSQHVEILFDLKKIMFGKQQDVALRSDDVLFIPSNAFKASIAAGGASVAMQAFYSAALLK